MLSNISEKITLYKLNVKKDPEAFAVLYDKYVKRIYRFVYFKVSSHEEAEDIVSDVFLKAWNYSINNDGKELKSFSGLLYRIARNCIIDFYRSKQNRTESLSQDTMEIGDGGKWYSDIDKNIDNQKVVLALKKLKQEYQEILTLRYVDELEIEEIVEITGKGNVAVRVTMHRALKKLKEILGEA